MSCSPDWGSKSMQVRFARTVRTLTVWLNERRPGPLDWQLNPIPLLRCPLPRFNHAIAIWTLLSFCTGSNLHARLIAGVFCAAITQWVADWMTCCLRRVLPHVAGYRVMVVRATAFAGMPPGLSLDVGMFCRLRLKFVKGDPSASQLDCCRHDRVSTVVTGRHRRNRAVAICDSHKLDVGNTAAG